jgi:DNA-binding response OmpR family regulator
MGEAIGRVVLIEDEQPIRDAVLAALRAERFAATAFEDLPRPADVLALAPDLAILDVLLPSGNGFELARLLRQQRELPIIFLTARDAVADRVAGLELGADDYLVKPFAFVELLARVRARLRRGQPMPERLQVGDLLLDCIRRKVTRSNENIELAPKEFSILEYLMRNRGRPLSRTMIVEHVWDMDYDGLTNIVDVYIRHLRSKIDDKFPAKMIHTVRGIGYMLDTPEKAVETPLEQVT